MHHGGAMLARVLAVGLLVAIAGCAVDASSDDPTADDSSEVKVDTRSAIARKQYDANASFAVGYQPRCASNGDPTRPRVLVTGFGRFMGIESNATGHVVSTLVGMPYPDTQPPAPGDVDPPEPQLAVKTTTIDLPGVGAVDVCGMVLPVYWDLAAILIAKEADAFAPSFVMMNGVAGSSQPLWLELGATNRAAPLDDGSSQLRPAVAPNEEFAKIVESAPASEDARPNLLSWSAVRSAAQAAFEARANDVDKGSKLSDVLQGAVFAGFPRSSNTYLCNNVTYLTGWLMGHPGRTVRVMRASPRKPGAINDVPVTIRRDLSRTPRVFVHWPTLMADAHHEAGAEIMKAILGAQLAALASGDAPTFGDNANADPSLKGGDTF